MLFRPDRVLREDPVKGGPDAGGDGKPKATTPGQASPLDKPTQTTRDLRAGRAPRSPNHPEEAEVTGVTNAEAEHLRIAQSKQREASLAAVNAAVEESIALDEKAAFEGEAQRLADFQGEMKELEQAALKSALNQAAQVQKLGREIGNMYPRPGRLFQDSSAAATWGAAMSLAAASFQSSRTGGPNAALGIIQQAIQQDIAAQEIEYDAKKTELGAAQTVYQELRQAYGDAQQAKSAQSAILMEAARHRLDAASRMAKTKMVMTPAGPANHFQVQAAITNEQLIQASNAELVKMAEISYRMTAAGAANTAEKRLAELLGRNPARLEAVLGGKKDLASLAQAAEGARQQTLADAKRAELRAKQSGATADVAASVADQAAEAAQAPPAAAPGGDVADTGDVGPARDQQVAALLEDASLENQMDFMRRRNKLTDETAQEFLGSLATGRTGAEGKPGMSPAAMAELFEAEARTLDSEPLGGQRAAELRQAAEQLRGLKQAVVASAEEGAGFEQQERSARETAAIDKALPGVRTAMNEGWSKAFGGEGGMAARNQDARVATVAAASELPGNEGRLVRSSLRDAIPLDAYRVEPGPNRPWTREHVTDQFRVLRALGGALNTNRGMENLGSGHFTIPNGGLDQVKWNPEARKVLENSGVNLNDLPAVVGVDFAKDGTPLWDERVRKRLSEHLGTAMISGAEFEQTIVPKRVRIPKMQLQPDGTYEPLEGQTRDTTVWLPALALEAINADREPDADSYSFAEASDNTIQSLDGTAHVFSDFADGKEIAQVRGASRQVNNLRRTVAASTLYAAAAGSEWMTTLKGSTGSQEVSAEQIGEAWEALKKNKNTPRWVLRTLSGGQKGPPASKDEEGNWKVNYGNPTVASLAGDSQQRDDGDVALFISNFSGALGSLSHFYGFMAPQKAELQLVEKASGVSELKLYDVIGHFFRDNAGPAQAAAFARDIESRYANWLNAYTWKRADMAEVYKSYAQGKGGKVVSAGASTFRPPKGTKVVN